MTISRNLAVLLGGCANIALAVPAIAQDDEQTTGLTEIVVTAQKRSENVQNTPLAVTAVTGDSLVSAGISEVRELNRIDPTLQIGQATGVVTTFIRGVGNPVTTAGNEASVPVYIDDVYFIRAAAPFFNLSSVDRVEVLKGPQGTLFGRNASGGVISVYTRDPSMDWLAVELRAGYSNYDTVDLKGYFNIPVTDRIAMNFAASYHKQDKGWGKVKQLVDPFDTSKGYAPGGQDYWKDKSYSLRGKILAELTDTTTVKLVGYYQKARSEIGFYARPFPGTPGGTPDGAHNGFADLPAMFPVPSQELPELGFYDVALPLTREPGSRTNTGPQYDDSDGYGFSARIDQETSFADLVSITAYRKNNEVFWANGNYSPYPWAFYDLNIIDKQFSQEFQIKSKADSDIKWIMGGYYLNATGGFGPTLIHGPAVQGLGLTSIALNGQQKVKSYAGFGQVTYPVTDTTNITAGLRYTKDKVIGKGCTQITFTPETADFLLSIGTPADTLAELQQCADTTGAVSDISPSFSKVTWKGSIDQKIDEDAMVYASISRGYKAGTFNTLPLDADVLEPEVVDAYEIGLKSELLDRMLRVNVAFFWNDIKNPQVQAQRNGLVFLENAGSARTKGVEIDTTLAPTQGLTLRLAASYLDAKFRDFKDAPSYLTYEQCLAELAANTNPAAVAGCSAPPPSPGNLNTYAVDATGNRMPYASKFKATAAIDYETDVANLGNLQFNLTGNYSSKFNWDADNVIKEPAQFLLDGSVAVTPTSLENLTVRLWMKNITDRKYNLNYYAQASGSAYSTAPGSPRTYGVEVVVNW